MATTQRIIMGVALMLLFGDAGGVYMLDGERKSFRIARADQPPVIDGLLDDDVWLSAVVIDDFHQTAPADGAAPTEVTEVRVAYDDEYLYIAADLHDSEPAAIRAKQMIQGRMFMSDDRFWVTIDSFNNKRNDYFFQVNANGVRREALRENNARFIEEWEAIWHAQSRLTDHGWSTEIAIPFKSISFAPDVDTWGINFGRGIVRKQEYNMWASYERQDWPAYSGEVTGIGEIEQGRGLDIVPSVLLRHDRDFQAQDVSQEFEPSLDVRYRITPSLSATFTLNTDFSTTEVDEQQVALDRFSLFFPEKRDFFLQDAGIFEFGNIDTNGRPFFSRRIGLSDDGDAVPIIGGAKVTGRVGAFNVGALAIRQDAWGEVGEQDLLVARGAWNVLDESAVGFIMTHGDPASDVGNTVAGVDFLYRDSDGPFGEILTGRFWAQQSDTTGRDGDDRAFGANLEIPSDRLRAYLDLQQIGEDFYPALGFVNRAGIRRAGTGLRYRTRPDSGPWRAVNHSVDAVAVTDMDGATLSRFVSVQPLSLYSHADDLLFVEWQRNFERVLSDFELFDRLGVPAGDYEFDRVRVELATGIQRPLRVVLSVQDGGFFGGDRLEKFVELQWRQSAYLFLGVAFTENEVSLPSGSFTSHLASLRSDVAFNARWSWTNLLQYDNTSESVAINSRLRYTPEAGQEFVVVLDHGGTVDPANRIDSTHSDVAVKVLYTFRY